MNNKISGLRYSVSGNLFERTVVGFDLRKNSSLDSLFMTSYDEAVRYEEINEQYRDQQSGLNLFCIDPSDISSLTVPVDARIIAFDLPTEFVEYLLKGNVSSPHPLPLPLKNSGTGWKFMGFDIVDAITQTSAFHGFDLTKSYLNEVMEKYTLRFNDCGLIDNAESASIVAKFFDKLILEHTPFMPCGVWLKEKNKAILTKIESKGPR